MAGTIRFEDLGRPIQKLLIGLKGGYTEEDMGLMAYVHVKDMVKIYEDLNSAKAAEQIWKDLKKELMKRKEEKDRADQKLNQDLNQTEQQLRDKEKEIADDEEAERLAEEKRQRKKEKKKKKQEEAAAAAAAAEAEAEAAAEAEAEVAAEAADEEAEQQRLKEERRLAKQKKKEEKEAALRAEEERLAREEAEEEARLQEEKKARKAERKKLKEEAARLREEENQLRQVKIVEAKSKKAQNLREAWEEHVKNHPLEFTEEDDGEVNIVQKEVVRDTKPPPQHFLKVKSILIPSVEEQDEATFYMVEVSLHNGKTQSVRRRYNQFFDMRSNLGGTLEALDVSFPGKTLWKVKGPSLDKRRQDLELWVNNVIDKLSTTRSYAGVQLDAKQQLRGDAARAEAEKQRMRQAAIARAALHQFCGIADTETS